MKYLIRRLQLGALIWLFSYSVFAQDLLIQNALIIDSSMEGDAQAVDILVQDKRITALGSDLAIPDGVRVIDAQGRPVTPGLFNANTQLGLVEVNAVADSVDSGSENQDITASLRVRDAYNASSTLIPYNRMLGITHSLIQPSSRAGLFAGIASVIRLTDTDGVVVEDAAMVVSLGNAGSAMAGGSRAAAMAMLREAIEDARDYVSNKESFQRGNRRSYSLSRRDLDALVPVVQKRLPLLVRVERASDIERVLSLAKEYDLNLILSGVSEAWLVADKIAAASVPVIFDPIFNLPSSYETLGSRLDNAKLLNDAGVKIMFTGMDWHNTHNAYLVRQSAGNAVANGLPYKAAIKAITSTPSQVFGLGDYGQIKVGADATLVLWSNDPLEISSNPDLVMIEGESYALESRATRLRDRYFEQLKAAP